jgi:hypothetical protein
VSTEKTLSVFSDALRQELKEILREVIREEIVAAVQPKELLTAEELARKLKVPLSWVYEKSRQDQIPTQRIGAYIRFDLNEVLRSQAFSEKKLRKVG